MNDDYRGPHYNDRSRHDDFLVSFVSLVPTIISLMPPIVPVMSTIGNKASGSR